MSDRGLLATWIDAANKRMSKQEDKHDELRIEFTELRAEYKTRNRIIWALVGLLFAAGGLIVTIIALHNKTLPL